MVNANELMNYILQVGIFVTSIVVIIFDFLEIKGEYGKRKKNFWKIGGHVLIFVMISIFGAWGSVWQSVTITEELTRAKGNVRLEGTSENITLWPKEKVEEPIDLIMKDSFTHFSYDYQYNLRSNNSLFVKFIFTETREGNRELADRGFSFTYKTKAFLFSPRYFKSIFLRGSLTAVGNTEGNGNLLRISGGQFHSFIIEGWLKMFSNIVIGIILLIYFTYQLCKHRIDLSNLMYFLFFKDKFTDECRKEAINGEFKNNRQFKEKYESDQKFRQEKIIEYNRQFSRSSEKLKNSISQALFTVIRILLFSFGIACISASYISLGRGGTLIIQILSTFLILWALVGKLGWSLQTWKGETLPEKVNDFWFKLLNILGLLLLFFALFYDLLKKYV